MRIFTGLLLFCLLNTYSIFGSSSRFWVNGSGSWNDTNHWSLSSGGEGGASIPGMNNNVFFDQNSFSETGETVSINGAAECGILHWRYTGKFPVLTGNRRSTLQVNGSLIIDDNLVNEFKGRIILTSETGENIFYSKTEFNSDIVFKGEGEWVLNSSLKTKGRLEVEKLNLQPEGNIISSGSFRGNREQEDILIFSSQPVTATVLKSTSSTLEVTAVGSTVSCFGSCDGTAEVTSVTGGVPPYDYQWYDQASNPIPGATGTSISGLCAGTYTVRVRDSQTPLRNVVFKSMEVLNPPSIGITDVELVQISCFNANDGMIQISAFGGTGTLSYSIDGGLNFSLNNLFTDLSAGDYNIVVTDANACTRVYSGNPVSIINPSPIVIDSESKTDVTGCFGNANGSVTVTASGGSGTLTYTLNPGSIANTTGVFNDLTAGTYTVDVTDANGCGPVTSGSLIITQPLQLQITGVNHSDVNCAGEAEGTITVTTTGGTGTIYYTLNPGAITNSTGIFGSLFAGSYTVSVTDDNGCGPFTTSSILITEPPAIQITGSSKTDITCSGLSNGSITITASGGTGVLSYSISPGAETNTDGIFTNLAAGSYIVSVTDDNLCGPFNSASIEIIEPAAITITSVVSSGTSCFGGNDGNITVSANGGTGTLTYTLSPGAVSNTNGVFDGLTAGSYTVSVTDANLCGPVSTGSVNVVEPPALQITSVNSVNVSCAGGSDGSITVAATGGTSTITYTLSPGSVSNTTGIFVGLVAGDYTVSVTDVNNCGPVVTGAITITQPPAISITGESKTDISCFGLTDGTITITSSGGTGILTYTLNPGAVSNTNGIFEGLGLGIYTVSVTDVNGCGPVVSNSIEIIEPAQIQITGVVKTDISCFGETNGTITATATGGIAPLVYTLLPIGTVNSTGIFTDLAAGNYSVSVEDFNGCGPITSAPVEIIEPAEISAIVTVTDALCNGTASGSLLISAADGVSPYSYSIDGGVNFQAGSSFLSLTAGSYHVVIRDANSCTKDAGIFVISEPDPVTFTYNSTIITCYGLADGSIEFFAAGGTPPYQYSIYGNDPLEFQSGNLFTNLGPETYELIVKDINGCLSGIVTVTLDDPDQIFVGFSAPAITTCFGDPGSITLTGTGGSGSLEYSISTTQFIPGAWQESGEFNNLQGGVPYYGFVRDVVSNCIVYANDGNSITINQPSEINYNVTSVVHVTGCSYSTNGEIRISLPTGGSPPYTYFINGVSNGSSRIFSNLGVGNYLIEVVDSKGCRKPTNVTINGPAPIVYDSFVKTDVNTCYGDDSGSVIVSASGGTGALSYSLNGGIPQADGSFLNLVAGDYTIEIFDLNACIKDTTITIIQPALLTISVVKTNVTCFGADDGTITVTISGGVMPYGYSIDNGLTFVSTESFTGLAPGSYSVVGRDANGCIQHGGNFNVTEPPLLVINSETFIHPTNCPGDPGDGSITITATGGTTPLQYSIDGGTNYFSNGGSFTGLSIGTYQIAVRDNRGCVTAGSEIILTGIPPIVLNISKSDISCFGQTDGSITINASGGGGTFDYSINNGLDFFPLGNFINLLAGDYEILVRDNLGCTQNGGTITIIEPAVLSIDDVQIIHVIQGGPSDIGELTIMVSGGTPAYEYSIDGGMTFSANNHFTGLTAGTYNIVVRDSRSCVTTISVDIDELPPFTVVINLTNVSCFGLNDGSIILSASDGIEPFEYSIDGGLSYFSSGIFTDLPGGIYPVRIIDAGGFTFNSNVTVNEPSDIIITGVTSDATCNLSTDDGSITIDVTGGTAPYAYLWSDGSSNKDVANAYGGSYTLTVADDIGCFKEATFMVNWIHEVTVDLGSDFSICPDETVQLDASYTQSGSVITFSWFTSPSEVIDAIQNPIVQPSFPNSVYTVTATDENGCFATSTLNIGVYEVPEISAGADTTIQAGESITLIASPDLFASYSWSPAEGLNTTTGISVIATPQGPITYYVTGLTTDGCSTTDSVFINIASPINPTSGLTPNDDGINDFWEIENASDYPNIIVEVYNRYGQKLFHSKGYSDSQRWDGTYKGKPLPVGTYYFIINLNDSFGTKPITGPVTIVR